MLFWFPIVGLVLAVVGLILGSVAWTRASKDGRRKGMAIAATIISIVTLLISLLVTFFVFYLWGFFRDVLDNCTDPGMSDAQQNQCVQDQWDARHGSAALTQATLPQTP